MPGPIPFSSPVPALYLYPINESFTPKHISLLHGQHVKIGRQTNAKTTPGERNGYFDSKVLSRQHAEVWEDSGKVYIKDVKSSNGTFINGERLSPEGLESEPFELHSDDIVEFGIDIVGEDNKTIIHHKVAARVLCVVSEQDLQMATRAEQHAMQQVQYPTQMQINQQNGAGGPMNQQSQQPVPSPNNNGNMAGPSSAFSFAPNQQRRPQGISGMGGMGNSIRVPGKGGLTFDHIMTRLQGEIQKSRETGAELNSVNGAIHEIKETLLSGLPPNDFPLPQTAPLLRPPQQQQLVEHSVNGHDFQVASMNSSSSLSATQSASLLSDLQAQLHETQNSLLQHVEKTRALEGALKEQEVIRHEVRMLREMMEAVQNKDVRDEPYHRHKGSYDTVDDSADMEPDDDAMSIDTVIPHELERVEEEDEEQLLASVEEEQAEERRLNGLDDEQEQGVQEHREDEDDEERRQRREELGRPHTPEPSGLGRPSNPQTNISSAVVDDLNSRLSALSAQLESALELSSTLQVQHKTAQYTIETLENKVKSLEELVKATLNAQTQPQADPMVASHPSSTEERESLTSMINEWKKNVEGQWTMVQEDWNQERERLNRAREEYEAKSRKVDLGLEMIEKIQMRDVADGHDSLHGSRSGASMVRDSSHGLVTPPSPRSLSSDSHRPRRRRSSSSGRGRSSSRKRSLSLHKEAVNRGLEDDISPELKSAGASLATPAPSVRTSIGSLSFVSHSPPMSGLRSIGEGDKDAAMRHHPINVQTAVGVIVLSVAAAAVIWRVKPE